MSKVSRYLLLTTISIFCHVEPSACRDWMIQNSIASFNYRYGWDLNSPNRLWRTHSSCGSRLMAKESCVLELRGGATDGDDDNEEEGEEADEDQDEYDEDEYDEYDDEEEEEEEQEDGNDEEESDEIVQKDNGNTKSEPSSDYVDPYFLSPTTQIYAVIGCITLSQKIDLLNPKTVMLLRFAFISYIILQQVFVLYVRFMAKKQNDRTPVTIKNPISTMLKSQLGEQDGNMGMVKNLASSFLQASSTVLEYDLKQASGLQGGLLFNTLFMGLLHFRFKQIQPLLLQTTTGLLQMVYHPLFQVYVMGRNLERPFKTPPTPGAAGNEVADNDAKDEKSDEKSIEGKKEISKDDNDEKEDVEADDSEEEENDDDDEGEDDDDDDDEEED